ncbi:hypothetical protein [Bacillus thuringiensis]|uniref:hypothetical protein n=1 Tax=Bacillus thuringiensis TaxID=1428 RepID=UPI0034579913
MKALLIAEMKRAIEIMESKDEVKRTFKATGYYGEYDILDKEVIELRQLMLMIRKHSISFEKGWEWR